MPTTGTDPTGLPLRCYARHPTTDETIMLVRGQLGFWPAGTTLTPEKLNADLADQPTAAQAQAMLTGSMFGWHVLLIADVVQSPLEPADDGACNTAEQSQGGQQWATYR